MISIRERCGSLYGLLDLKVLQQLGSQYLASYLKKGVLKHDFSYPDW